MTSDLRYLGDFKHSVTKRINKAVSRMEFQEWWHGRHKPSNIYIAAYREKHIFIEDTG